MGSSAPLKRVDHVYSLHDALRELLREVMGTDTHPTDHSVHAARKTLKRARAALRLMRAGIGNAAYRSANKQLRDAARPLTPVRDAVALLHALQAMRKARDKKASSRYADELHRALQDKQRRDRDRLTPRTLLESSDKLRTVDLKMSRLPVKAPDAASARRGIKATFRKGREAFSEARKHPRVVLLHEWRKQAKYLANELELAERLLQLKLTRQRRRAGHLADVLGHDHDLALLCTKLSALSDSGNSKGGSARKRLERRIKQKRRKLQAKAYRLGRRLYRGPVAKFNRAVKKQLGR